MGITVADIMKLPAMNGAYVIAGKKGLSRQVLSIAVMEDQDSTSYLQSNNLVLTNGRVIGSNIANLPQFMKSFQTHNVAAVTLKVGKYLHEVPSIMQTIADAIELPIIILPNNTTSARVISAISYAIFCSEAHDSKLPYEIDLIRSIIIESEDWRTMKSRLITAGIDVRTRMGVIVIKRIDQEIDNDITPLCIECGFLHPFSLYQKNVACINLNDEQSYSAAILDHARSLEEKLRSVYPGSNWRIGVGKVCSNLLMLSLSYKEALSALCFGIATDAQKNTLAFRDLGIYTTLLQGRNRQDINAFILRVNLLIEQHDKKYKSELLNTLRTYALCDMSIPETAAALHVHDNTMRYRIDTIKKLLAEQFGIEEVGVNLEIICTLSRWIDSYNSEMKR